MIPRIPILPIYEPGIGRNQAVAGSKSSHFLDVENILYLDSGTSAIELALKYSGIQCDDEVLVPAYHCPTMVAPAEVLRAKVVYYKINWDTSVDMHSIKELITNRSKAILVPHFFGLMQEMEKIRVLCDRHELTLIEDCAHAFFGTANDRLVGSFGDFAIASTRKFFAGADGGCLVSKTKGCSNQECIRSRSILEEFKALIDIVEEAQHYGRDSYWTSFLVPILATKYFLKRILVIFQKRLRGDLIFDSTNGVAQKTEIIKMSRASRYLLRRADLESICRSRLKNFLYLVDRLDDVPGLKCLVTSVGDGMVPYMYPLIAENSDLYHALRDDNWPVWRWDDCDADCEVSRYYSEHLLQLPCHQSLRYVDLDRLVDAVIELNSNL